MITRPNRLVLLLLLCLLQFSAAAQKILVNSFDGLFELNGAPGECTLGPSIPYCDNNEGGPISSIALHNDILYFIKGMTLDLYRAVLGSPDQCQLVARLPEDENGLHTQYNALTADLYGNVYALSSSGQLLRYREGDAEPTILGKAPVGSGGDMLYYKGDLYYAGITGDIYKINLENPSVSSKHISVSGFTFIGLISFPSGCDENKVYGVADAYTQSQLVELDLDNKTYSGVVCTLPILALDAASVVEDGRTAGVLLDSVAIEPPCGKRSTGKLQLHAFSATPGPLTFTMDGRSNTTGYFDAVSAGAHAVRISNAIGCAVDTSIVVGNGLSTQFVVSKKNVASCTRPDGELSLSGVTTSYFPV
ncbi:MAG: hypothetical protein JNL51_12025, partial [Chitinophagaceae bacterium]|nr:hypothetical protein [Chitinophagaceae bacterium]